MRVSETAGRGGQMDPRSPCRDWMKGHLESTPLGGGGGCAGWSPLLSQELPSWGARKWSRSGVGEVLESKGPVLERTPAS